MEVKDKIDMLRKQRGWSRNKLAREAGLTASAVYNWYNDKNFTPSRDAIEDICVAFGISQAEFFCDVDVDNLDEREIKLLELFRRVPEKKKDKVLAVIETLAD